MPVTAIYRKNDAIVAWRACIDQVNPTVDHIEPRIHHLGVMLSPEVVRLVARNLAVAPS